MKKGFTLIELLAVIVILAIIALIATPIVLNLIKSAEKGAFLTSSYGMLDATNIYYYSNKLKTGNTVDRVNILQQSNGKDIIEFSGEKPDSGTIAFNNSGKTALAIKKGQYCASKSFEDEKIVVTEIGEGGTCILNENNEPVFSSSDDEPVELCYFDCDNETDNNEIALNYETINGTEILSIEDLVDFAQAVNNGTAVSGTYNLGKNIDFNSDLSYDDPTTTSYGDLNNNQIVESIKTEMTTGEGFIMIGTSSNKFQGTFSGNGYSIKNLYINKSSTSNVGLFSYTSGATIKSLKLIDAKVIGNSQVGSLIGNSASTQVNNLYAISNVSGGNKIGGLIGTSTALTISNSNISITGFASDNGMGGVTGYSTNGSYSDITGQVNLKSTSDAVGGIIGTEIPSTSVTLNNIKLKVNINSATGKTGGIIGNINSGSMVNLTNILINEGSTITSTSYVGGLVGMADSPFTIDNSRANATIKTSSNNEGNGFGGLVGEASQNLTIKNSSYNGTINAKNSYAIGGLIGNSTSSSGTVFITSSYATGKLYSTKSDGTSNRMGGLVGSVSTSSGYIKSSYSTMDIQNSTGRYMGGILGGIDGGVPILISYSLGDIVAGDYCVGGIVGCVSRSSAVVCSFSTSNIVLSMVPGFSAGDNFGKISGTDNIVNNSYYAESSTIKDSNNSDLTQAISKGTGTTYENIKSSTWQSALFNSLESGKVYYSYTDNYYPKVYKVDSSGSPTTTLVPFQKNIAVEGTDKETVNNQLDTTTITEIESQSINGTTDTEAPTCTLNYFNVYGSGFQASYTCTDNVGVTTKRHLYDARKNITISSFNDLEIASSSLTDTAISTWTVTSAGNQGITAPQAGQCYYFRYGASDAQGNYRTYKTQYCSKF